MTVESKSPRERSWLHSMSHVVLRMPERFQLHDLDVHFDTFRRAYPEKRKIYSEKYVKRYRNLGIRGR